MHWLKLLVMRQLHTYAHILCTCRSGCDQEKLFKIKIKKPLFKLLMIIYFYSVSATKEGYF